MITAEIDTIGFSDTLYENVRLRDLGSTFIIRLVNAEVFKIRLIPVRVNFETW